MAKERPQVQSALRLLIEEISTVLLEPYAEDDTIRECGNETLLRLRTNHMGVLQLAHSQLYACVFEDVRECWRRLYCEASLWQALASLQNVINMVTERASLHDILNSVGEVIRIIDKELIMTSAPGRYAFVQHILAKLSAVVREFVAERDSDDEPKSSSTTMLKADNVHVEYSSFQSMEPLSPNHTPTDNVNFELSKSSEHPSIQSPIHTVKDYSLPDFQAYLLTSHRKNGLNGPLPLLITRGAQHWPAVSNKLWTNPSYLLAMMADGHRLVPVEVGNSYTDDDWGQQLMPFRQFLHTYMTQTKIDKGYLAQHNLFFQVPQLKEDISTPDYCYSEPPKPEVINGSGISSSDQSEDDTYSAEPQLNVWMGSAHTVSPAHTDPHHNILVQVVGHKYVRLFSPSEKPKLYPHSTVNGVNMSNTSRVDVGEAMHLFEQWDGWEHLKPKSEGDRDPIELDDDIDSLREEFLENFPDYLRVKYLEGILGPSDCLYIPKGWFHYVRSLSPSISVSFWWD